MRRVLDRYILREVVTNWAVVTSVLLVILLTNQLARVLERAAENRYPQDVVLELIWLGALQNLSVIVPVGLLLGTGFAKGIVSMVNTETVRLPLTLTPSNYSFAALTVTIASTASALIVLRRLKQLDLVSALKAPE